MISIVLTTYNRANTLPRSLKSVLEQTYTDTEVLVVDDGSTDNTSAFITSVKDARVRYIKLLHNQGASVARNIGIREAKGEFILVWDSDDVLYPHALETVLVIFQRFQCCDVVSAPARIITDGAEVPFPAFPQGEVQLEDVLLKRLPSNEKVRVARASVMKGVAYKAYNIDFLVNVELVERGAWFHIGQHLADVFCDPRSGSLTSLRRKRNAQRSLARFLPLKDFLGKYGKLLCKIAPHRYADYAYGVALGASLAGDTKVAKHFAWHALRFHVMRFRHWMLYALVQMPGGTRILKAHY